MNCSIYNGGGIVLTIKETVFCSSMILELGFKGGFGSVPLYIGTSRRRQPHIQPSREAHRAETLLCVGISGGR